MDKKSFLNEPILESENHRPLLWLALVLTEYSKSTVAEFGAGTGSTPYIRKYCQDNDRGFIAFDSNKEWAEKWGAELVDNWNKDELYTDYSVVLIDQAPGEYRHQSMIKLKDKAAIIVVHDAEPEMNDSYLLESIWGLFKYRVFTKKDKIWAAAVSNHIDLNKHEGEMIGSYKIEI